MGVAIRKFRRNFLRQLPSAFDLRNKVKRKICFLMSSRLFSQSFFLQFVFYCLKMHCTVYTVLFGRIYPTNSIPYGFKNSS